MARRRLVVADIHGQIDIFRHIADFLMESADRDRKIEIGFVGDYGDRGKSGEFNGKWYEDIGSRLVYEKLFDLREHFRKKKIDHFFLRGNHERDLMGWIEHESLTTAKYTKDLRKTEEGLRAEPSIVEGVMAFLEQTTLYHVDEKEKLLFVHGGVDPEKENILESDPTYFLWARDHFYGSARRYPYRVIFGHTKMRVPMVMADRIGIDGGAYENGWLNVLSLEGSRAEILSFNAEGDMITRYKE